MQFRGRTNIMGICIFTYPNMVFYVIYTYRTLFFFFIRILFFGPRLDILIFWPILD